MGYERKLKSREGEKKKEDGIQDVINEE